MPNMEACGAIGRALLSVCGGAEASAGVVLYDYLNCNIVPGCPGGNVEAKDVDACVATIVSQQADGKAPLLACRDALAVECEIARADCGDPETPPTGGVIGFWTACSRLRTKLTDTCMISQDIRDTVASQAGADAVLLASLTEQAALDACADLFGCGRVAAFADTDLTLFLDDVDPTDCTKALGSVRTAKIDKAFCAPPVSATVTVAQ